MENNNKQDNKQDNSLFALEQGLLGKNTSEQQSHQPSPKKRKRPRQEARAFDFDEGIQLQYNGDAYPTATPAARSFSKSNSFASELEDESLPFEVEGFEVDRDVTPVSKPVTPQRKTPVKSVEVQPVQATGKVTSKQKVQPVQATKVEPSPPQEGLSDAQEFAADLQAILNGEKTYDAEQKQVVSTSPPAKTEAKVAPTPHPHDIFDKGETAIPPQKQVEPEPVPMSRSHAVFDQMGKNMAHATDFDQGTVDLSLEQRFDELDRILDEESKSSSKIAELSNSQRSDQHKPYTNTFEYEEENLTHSLAKAQEFPGISTAMSARTDLQTKINDLLTNKLNYEDIVYILNCFCIKELNDRLKNMKIELDSGDELTGEDVKFFVKGGTSLGLLFDNKEITNKDAYPNRSDWDTQLIINPILDFEVWYQALEKIEEIINEILILGNMLFSLYPGMGDLIKKTLPDDIQQKGHKISHSSKADRKSAHMCEIFHPMQPLDISRRLFAAKEYEKWMRPQPKDYEQAQEFRAKPDTFESIYPVGTVDVNVDEYKNVNTDEYKNVNTDEYKNVNTDEYKNVNTDEYKNVNTDEYKNVNTDEYKKKPSWEEASKELITLITPIKNIQQSLPAKNPPMHLSLSTPDEISQNFKDLTKPKKSKKQNNPPQNINNQPPQPPKPPKQLASMQKTLTIAEFYLYRLVVRYKYVKPVPAQQALPAQPPVNQQKDPPEGSGTLRGELIDISIPRRDSYECLHHWEKFHALEKDSAWEIEEVTDTLSGQKLPILKFGYHLEEQILMIREILAGKANTPHKIAKRLKRGYYLALIGSQKDDQNNGQNNSDNKKNVLMTLLKKLNENFTESYINKQKNAAVETKINDCYKKISQRVQNNTIRDKEFAKKLTRLKWDELKKTKLTEAMLKDIFAQKDNPTKNNYPKPWPGTDDKVSEGMIDFWNIIAHYSVLAEDLETKIKANPMELDQGGKDRKEIKDFYNLFLPAFDDDGVGFKFYPHLTGRAASYYHLMDLKEVFKDNITNTLIVDSIDWKIVVPKGADISKLKDYLPSQYDEKMFVEVDNIRDPEYQIEYSFGIPVLNLKQHIKDVQAQAHSAEFLHSQRLKQELAMLQSALTIREYTPRVHKDMPPPMLRKLSTKRIDPQNE
ncbi:MAG: hypothetical protein F6K23_27670 [Okeania sp. SIO2C9]|uniref:hypothetical protein n=1 Tax=Okeania sp. SIO2C9 TaxID=2607791 RepID=UPI0013C1C676|nr:hypothetical protein [Okeania sp. SIO2C9]NEQ76480.1 hypothetical protein [Okeania sp. SIO2C9]